jgi:hypothetical protein
MIRIEVRTRGLERRIEAREDDGGEGKEVRVEW